MAANRQSSETPEQREWLLRQLSPPDRQLVERVMAHHPRLTAAEAIEHLRAFGGL
jgi:hypothetical protein